MLIAEEVVAIALVMAAVAVVAGLIVDRERLRAAGSVRLDRRRNGAAVAVVLFAVPLYYQFFGPLALPTESIRATSHSTSPA